MSRLAIGFLADYLSAPKTPALLPPSAETPPLSVFAAQVEESKKEPYKRRLHLSKPHMLLITLVGLGAVYLFAAAGGIQDVDRLWVLTSVVGWSYGTIFVSLSRVRSWLRLESLTSLEFHFLNSDPHAIAVRSDLRPQDVRAKLWDPLCPRKLQLSSIFSRDHSR